MLTEVSALKKFINALVPIGSAPKGGIGRSEAETKCKELVNEILKSFKLKILNTDVREGEEGVMFRYHLNGYMLKAWVVYETRFLNLALWSEDGKDLLDVLAMLEIDKKIRIQAIAKMRAKKWLKG